MLQMEKISKLTEISILKYIILQLSSSFSAQSTYNHPINLYAVSDFYIYIGIKITDTFKWGEQMKHKQNKKEKSVLSANLSPVHLEISGNREIIFEGSKGVLEYGDTAIKINTGKYIVCINGRGLYIKCMNECDMVIQGFITSIEYIM